MFLYNQSLPRVLEVNRDVPFQNPRICKCDLRPRGTYLLERQDPMSEFVFVPPKGKLNEQDELLQRLRTEETLLALGQPVVIHYNESFDHGDSLGSRPKTLVGVPNPIRFSLIVWYGDSIKRAAVFTVPPGHVLVFPATIDMFLLIGVNKYEVADGKHSDRGEMKATALQPK